MSPSTSADQPTHAASEPAAKCGYEQKSSIRMPSENPETATPNRSLGSWSFFIRFCLWSLMFFAAQFLYQFTALVPSKLEIALIRSSALTGMTLISASLCTSAVFRWRPRLARHWRIRRYLGVAGVVFIIIHVSSAVTFLYEQNLYAVVFSWNPYANPVIFGVIAYPILLIMALTSTDWAVRMLGRRWKTIHRLIYVAFPAAILHTVLLSSDLLSNPAGLLLLALTAAAAFGQIFWFLRISALNRFRPPASVIGAAIIITFAVLLVIGLYRRYGT